MTNIVYFYFAQILIQIGRFHKNIFKTLYQLYIENFQIIEDRPILVEMPGVEPGSINVWNKRLQS